MTDHQVDQHRDTAPDQKPGGGCAEQWTANAWMAPELPPQQDDHGSQTGEHVKTPVAHVDDAPEVVPVILQITDDKADTGCSQRD